MKLMKINENQKKVGGILKICTKTTIVWTEMHFLKKEIAADIFQKSGKFESRSSKPAQSAQAMPLPLYI